MNKKLLIIVGATIILALIAVGVYFALNRPGEEEVEPAAIAIEYTPGEYFVTNVKDSNRLLKVAPVLIIDSPEAQEIMEKNNSLIRDKVIFILRTLSEEDIRSNDTIADLRGRIINELNQSLGITNIVDVRFNDFVMQ